MNRLLALALALSVAVATLTTGAAPAHAASTGAQYMVSSLQPGVTHINASLDPWNDPASVRNGHNLLLAATTAQTQWLMGGGAMNPEPSPGVYDWSSLDNRFNTVMAGSPVKTLTACCAPDWMKGGAPGTTDWAHMSLAPLPTHYDDYAKLVAAAVARYPSIQYVQVWAELQGFWLQSQNRWDYQGYTALYNRVYTRVKAVRSSVRVGGPYMPMPSYGSYHSYNSNVGGPYGWIDQRSLDVIKYWMQYKVGADFLAADAHNRNKDDVQPTSEWATLDKWGAFRNWFRGLDPTVYPGSRTLPIRWVEWYSLTFNDSDSDAKKNAVVVAAGLIRTIKTGAQLVSLWGVTGDTTGHYYLAHLTVPNHELTMLTDATNVGGALPTSLYWTMKYVHDNFSSGAALVQATNTNANVETIATTTAALLVNRTPSAQVGIVAGIPYVLTGYQVSLLPLP